MVITPKVNNCDERCLKGGYLPGMEIAWKYVMLKTRGLYGKKAPADPKTDRG
jgi:hypothetical protein